MTTMTKVAPAYQASKDAMLFAHQHLLDDEPCNDDFVDRFDGHELSWP
jgi:hypothetical protein